MTSKFCFSVFFFSAPDIISIYLNTISIWRVVISNNTFRQFRSFSDYWHFRLGTFLLDAFSRGEREERREERSGEERERNREKWKIPSEWHIPFRNEFRSAFHSSERHCKIQWMKLKAVYLFIIWIVKWINRIHWYSIRKIIGRREEKKKKNRRQVDNKIRRQMCEWIEKVVLLRKYNFFFFSNSLKQIPKLQWNKDIPNLGQSIHFTFAKKKEE